MQLGWLRTHSCGAVAEACHLVRPWPQGGRTLSPGTLYSVFLWPEEFWDQETLPQKKQPKELEKLCILWSCGI